MPLERIGLAWRLYWTLVQQNKRWIYGLLKASAKDAPNRGSVFEFDEFRTLVTTTFKPEDVCFPVWVLKRFMAVSLLLGALRSEQFDRFREGGLASIEFLRENRDENHHIRNHLRHHKQRA